MFKAVKKQRRLEIRTEVSEADRAVVAATATGSPNRIDDETQGIPLLSNVPGASAGTLTVARACYICKQKYRQVDAFYHQLCPACAALNHARREARTDLTGRRALLTGGRAKIGMYIALRLLRDGAHTTITTRFPNDAVRRFTALADSGDWLHRLRIVGIDLRDPAQVVALADTVSEQGPLDILINNAAQTVRRSPGAYAPLAAAESAPLRPHQRRTPVRAGRVVGRASAAAPAGAGADRPRHDGRFRGAGPGGRPDRDRRRRPGTRSAFGEQLDPEGGRGRSAGTAGGAAVQHHRPVHPDQPIASGAGRGTGPAQVRGQRLGHGRGFQPWL
jgi:hypothetical protein